MALMGLRLVGAMEARGSEFKGEEGAGSAIERTDRHEDDTLLLQLVAERMETGTGWRIWSQAADSKALQCEEGGKSVFSTTIVD